MLSILFIVQSLEFSDILLHFVVEGTFSYKCIKPALNVIPLVIKHKVD